jgi:hypothetical protein
MNTILVWVMVTIGGYNGDQVVYSPPMPDLATCEFLKTNTREVVQRVDARCIQIKMVVTK